MSRRRIAVLLALAVPLLVAAVSTIAWAIDTRGDHDVRRGVELAGNDVAGLSRAALTRRVEAMAHRFARTPVSVNGGDQKLDTTAKELGLSVDVNATVDAAFAAGRHDPGVAAPFRWAKALVVGREIGVQLVLNRQTATKELLGLEGSRRATAVEPRLEVREGKVTVTPGHPGGGLGLDAALSRLPHDVTDLSAPILVRASRTVLRPRISETAATMLAVRANQITEHPLELRIGSTTVALDSAKLRPGFTITLEGDAPRLALDPAVVAKVLEGIAPGGINPTGAHFMLRDGRMDVVAGHDAVVCCGDDALQLIVAALLDAKTSVELPTRTISAADGTRLLTGLGVKEVVGEFTTRHPAGQPRVRNIHRIADIIRGVLIAPGATFSINDFVGRRTADKGFVSAPVIDEGQFKEDIGGGVSQFATTLFNAAFFAGLDIPEHKAHSIYISRYPFGREATLAYPSVDLKIRNNTPYGVVIWPTYTANSLTVQLWSTRFVAGAQTAQNKSSGCGKVTTTRTRLFVDGHTDQQTYRADYNCNPPSH